FSRLMNPKPLLSLNHLTVPTSRSDIKTPQDNPNKGLRATTRPTLLACPPTPRRGYRNPVWPSHNAACQARTVIGTITQNLQKVRISKFPFMLRRSTQAYPPSVMVAMLWGRQKTKEIHRPACSCHPVSPHKKLRIP